MYRGFQFASEEASKNVAKIRKAKHLPTIARRKRTRYMNDTDSISSFRRQTRASIPSSRRFDSTSKPVSTVHKQTK